MIEINEEKLPEEETPRFFDDRFAILRTSVVHLFIHFGKLEFAATGTLININDNCPIILTAAHNLVGILNGKRYDATGVRCTNSYIGVHEIDSFLIHPEYCKNPLIDSGYDLAIAHLVSTPSMLGVKFGTKEPEIKKGIKTQLCGFMGSQERKMWETIHHVRRTYRKGDGGVLVFSNLSLFETFGGPITAFIENEFCLVGVYTGNFVTTSVGTWLTQSLVEWIRTNGEKMVVGPKRKKAKKSRVTKKKEKGKQRNQERKTKKKFIREKNELLKGLEIHLRKKVCNSRRKLYCL